MDYLYENLGDDRFQEFCSALICKEFPNVQAFPVGQPDGGRDSLAYIFQSPKKEFVVFQVKYVKNPQKEDAPHTWLIKKLEEEAPKIAKLIPKGAKSYHFITNINGTSHLDSGSIDKVNKIFEDYIGIPSTCWWREDISRRIEKDPIFKWSFPQILDGQSILNSILFENITEDRQKREDAIKAYLIDQYDIDNKVKFRQVDLESDLLNLFTDVPMRIKNSASSRYKDDAKMLFFSHLHENRDRLGSDLPHKVDTVDAASFFLKSSVQEKLKKVILEGGPGQGKSTVSQYICQVHRAILLNKRSVLNSLPDDLQNTNVRLPFKIDLRHLAAWVEGENPYKETLNEEVFKEIHTKSLESFLSGHICSHSQQMLFRVDDLMAVSRKSPLLMIFDGFDEIANSAVRKSIIELIDKGLNRLSEIAISIQVIITSRPAAFSSSLSFNSSNYPHFELTDINKSTIDNYVKKWVKANRLNSRESQEIKRMVDEKLSLPHLRDLAKSPMQLVIFISLLRTRGESLPNKRTALYDSYIDLFFNRESEKNDFIRLHRDVIIEIHGYLAWILHSEAELYKKSGVIEINKLKNIINSYLTNEGLETNITDKLFKAVEERVCALVSRVQGTFEFEVQPLREYFCAKYLYETAPYSPAGSEKSGTKPDRFNAIARNPYWQNVVRFFAGCFDKGELPMLIDSLKSLRYETDLKYTNYPQVLTSNLLSDYVFTQYPRYLKDVVEIIISSIHIGNLTGQSDRFLPSEPIVIPKSCGNEELLSECFSQLIKTPPVDYAYDLISLVVNNASIDEVKARWVSCLPNIKKEEIVRWVFFARYMNIIHIVDEKILINLYQKITDGSKKNNFLKIVFSGNNKAIFDNNKDYKRVILREVLDGLFYINRNNINGSLISYLSVVLSPNYYIKLLNNDNDHGFQYEHNFYSGLNKKHGKRVKGLLLDEGGFDEVDQKIKIFIAELEEIFESQSNNWKNSIDSWDALVEHGRASFGRHNIFIIISVIASGIKARRDKFEDFDDFFDENISLCKRVRCARMKSGNLSFWSDKLVKVANSDVYYLLIVLFAWATPRVFESCYKLIENLLKRINDKQYNNLYLHLNIVARVAEFSKKGKKQIDSFFIVKNVSTRFSLLLFLRYGSDSRHNKYVRGISFTEIEELPLFVMNKKLSLAVSDFLYKPDDESLLLEVERIYSITKNINALTHSNRNYFPRSGSMLPYNVSVKIITQSKKYPRTLSTIAERSCRGIAFKNSKQVGLIADEECWFNS